MNQAEQWTRYAELLKKHAEEAQESGSEAAGLALYRASSAANEVALKVHQTRPKLGLVESLCYWLSDETQKDATVRADSHRNQR